MVRRFAFSPRLVPLLAALALLPLAACDGGEGGAPDPEPSETGTLVRFRARGFGQYPAQQAGRIQYAVGDSVTVLTGEALPWSASVRVEGGTEVWLSVLTRGAASRLGQKIDIEVGDLSATTTERDGVSSGPTSLELTVSAIVPR